MLRFGQASGGGRGNGPGIVVLSTFVAPSICPSKSKRACLSSSSCAVGVPIFVLPCSLMSPTLQCVPSTLSFTSSPPPAVPMATHQSTAAPVVVVLMVVVIMASRAFDSLSRTQMMADVESPDALHTLVVCGSRMQERLAPMSMWEVLGRLGWGWGPNSRVWRWSA